ncbi:4'-phosphopantetheinyl transferase superfamily protein [Streptomyces sp. S1]|uniref:4'-phosphopantetheinyl transferase family protein n=1 Tax=Streptomyces sp. S1 TaxID=718288 RepID=UPI000EF7F326|nr:4'-phosphopantetheinyl transferase superfamily protein [Streptomyces sp. S1]
MNPSSGAPKAGLLSRVLPVGVAGVESWADGHEITLFPAEEEYIAGAAPSRRREFRDVRWCARRALASLGAPPGPLVPTATGAEFLVRYPAWPAGYTGSLTHCDGYRAAAVAAIADVLALGIDAEPHDRLPAPALGRVAGPEELEHLAALRAERPEVAWDRVLFSAKESVYKAWFPLTRRWFDIRDCPISIDPYGATFTAGPALDPPEGVTPVVFGRWAVSGALAQGHVVTSAVIR